MFKALRSDFIVKRNYYSCTKTSLYLKAKQRYLKKQENNNNGRIYPNKETSAKTQLLETLNYNIDFHTLPQQL